MDSLVLLFLLDENQHISVKKRLHYFDTCVAPSILFAMSALQIRQAKLKAFDILQRKMIRSIVGRRRVEGEDWSVRMRRMNDRMAQAVSQYQCEDWSSRLLRNKWRYGIHLASKPSDHWGKKMEYYICTSIDDPDDIYVASRTPGRPRL